MGMNRESPESIIFSATKRGFACDDPTDPMKLEEVTCDECARECEDSATDYLFPIRQVDRVAELVPSSMSLSTRLEAPAALTRQSLLGPQYKSDIRTTLEKETLSISLAGSSSLRQNMYPSSAVKIP